MRMALRLRHNMLIALGFSVLLTVAPLASASPAEEYFQDAQGYLAKGEINAAIIQLKNALQSDPTHVASRLALGSLRLRTNDGPSAAKEFGRARDLGAPKSQWMLGYVRALAMQQDFRGIVDAVQIDDTLSAEDAAELLAWRGNAYLALDNTGAAVNDYDAALARQPGNPTASLGKVRVLLEDARREEATQLLDRVIAANPQHYESLVTRGDLLRTEGRLDEAARDFQSAKEANPNDPRADIGLAFVHVAKGDQEAAQEAIDSLRRIVRDLPVTNYLQALVAYRNGDLDTASDQLQVLLRAAPSSLQGQLLYGVVSYAREEYTIADDYLSRVLASTPGNEQVVKLVAAARLKLRQPERAIQALERVVNDQTRDAQLLALMGTAQMQSGNNSAGAQLIERAVEIDPEQAKLRTQLAVGRLASGDTSGAIAELESAVALDQDVLQADVLLVLGYLNKRDYDNALSAAAALEERMPDSPVPYNLTGLAHLAQRQFDAARERFEMALEKDPGFLVAHMNLARVAIVAQQPEQAEAAYRAVLEQDPGHMGALLGMSTLKRRLGDEAAAIEWVQKANRANPSALQPIMILAEGYLRTNEPLKASTVLSGVSPDQAESPAILRLKGMTQLQSGEYASAVFTLRRLTEVQPDAIEGWFQLARAQAAMGNNRDARESFQRATALDTGYSVPMVWVGLAELELRDKRFQAALELAQQIKQHFPDNVIGYDIEANALTGLGKADEALAASTQALRVQPNSRRVNRVAGQLTAAGRVPEAIAVLGEWVKQSPRDALSLSRLGMLEQHRGNVDAALDAYERAAALSARDPVLLNNMAWLYLGRDNDRAVELATKAYEADPTRAEIVDTYGWVLLQTGREREGLSALQQALIIAPSNAEIALHVAKGLRKVGRGKEAVPILRRITREHPNTEHARTAQEMLQTLSG
jgi:putative PEP-CTERM system TPR-repeat lipoprotein